MRALQTGKSSRGIIFCTVLQSMLASCFASRQSLHNFVSGSHHNPFTGVNPRTRKLMVFDKFATNSQQYDSSTLLMMLKNNTMTPLDYGTKSLMQVQKRQTQEENPDLIKIKKSYYGLCYLLQFRMKMSLVQMILKGYCSVPSNSDRNVQVNDVLESKTSNKWNEISLVKRDTSKLIKNYIVSDSLSTTASNFQVASDSREKAMSEHGYNVNQSSLIKENFSQRISSPLPPTTVEVLGINRPSHRTPLQYGGGDCEGVVSCVHPYISYIAGTIMFFLVVYLIVVFGKCVCDENY